MSDIKRHEFCKLDILTELELCSLYDLGLSTYVLGKFYKICQFTACDITHKYHTFGIHEKIRNDQESVRARYFLDGTATSIPEFPSSTLVPRLIELGLEKYFDRLICVFLQVNPYKMILRY